jgi:uncharacterized protein YqeY
MLSLSQIESDIKDALKARDSVAADTLRGLKTRIQNEQIAKTTASSGKALSEDDLVALVRSEVKRRKEAAAAFGQGGRAELQEKELKESAILEKYLPPQLSEENINSLADKVISEGGFAAKDFGQAMGKLKAAAGSGADGGTLARVLKEKLK